MTETENALGITAVLDLDYDQAVERTVAALKEQGFGVLTEIDVKATLKKKLDVDFQRYLIIGACNPPLAHQALTEEPLIGLLLPCNVTVLQEDDQTINVTFIKPSEMFKVIDNPSVASVASEVDAKLVRAMERL